MEYAATNLGYNINRKNNGIALPGRNLSTTDVLASGLPYHGGRHQSEYDRLLHQRLAALDRDYKAGLLDDASIMDGITQIENQMRSDLLNDVIRLQQNDPRP